MVQGSMLLSIWPKESNFIYGPAPPAGSNCDPDHPIIGVDINSPVAIKYPSLEDSEYSVVKGDFNSLDQQTQEQLLDINEMDMLEKVPPDIREVKEESEEIFVVYGKFFVGFVGEKALFVPSSGLSS